MSKWVKRGLSVLLVLIMSGALAPLSELSALEINIPAFPKLSLSSVSIQMPKLSLPDISLRLPKLSQSDVTIRLPKLPQWLSFESFSVQAAAADGQYTSGDYEYSVSGGIATITKYNGAGGNVVIPNSLDGYSVRAIGDRAFFGCSGLTSINMGSAVTSIGQAAFYRTGLLSITIPEGITHIGDFAFNECPKLTSIQYNAINLEEEYNVYNRLFDSAGKEGEGVAVIIGDTVQSIPTGLFDCSSYPPNIKSVLIGRNVKTIGKNAFYNCNQLTNISIPESVASIGANAFYNCIRLTNIQYNAVNATGGSFFNGAGTSGEGVTVVIGDSVASIPAEFLYRAKIKQFTYGRNVNSIGNSAFYQSTGLTEITIPDSVTNIGSSAFGSLNVTSITIGKGAVTVGRDAFSNCKELTSINYNAVHMMELYNPGYNPAYDYIFTNAGNDGNGISVVFGEAVERIPSYLLYNTKTKFVVIGNNVKSIGESAFRNCSVLSSVTIGTSLTNAGVSAFSGCIELTSVLFNAAKFADSTGSLFVAAGKSDPGFTVVFGETVERIPAYLFYNTNIKTATIGQSVKSIGNFAFSSCAGLTNISLGRAL